MQIYSSLPILCLSSWLSPEPRGLTLGTPWGQKKGHVWVSERHLLSSREVSSRKRQSCPLHLSPSQGTWTYEGPSQDHSAPWCHQDGRLPTHVATLIE